MTNRATRGLELFADFEQISFDEAWELKARQPLFGELQRHRVFKRSDRTPKGERHSEPCNRDSRELGSWD